MRDSAIDPVPNPSQHHLWACVFIQLKSSYNVCKTNMLCSLTIFWHGSSLLTLTFFLVLQQWALVMQWPRPWVVWHLATHTVYRTCNNSRINCIGVTVHEVVYTDIEGAVTLELTANFSEWIFKMTHYLSSSKVGCKHIQIHHMTKALHFVTNGHFAYRSSTYLK